MADTDLMLTVLALKNEVCRKLGWPSDITDWSGETRLSAGEKSTVIRIMAAGLRRFYHCGHPWSFLRPRASFTAWTTCTGVITDVSDQTTVTADAAVFVPEMVGAIMVAQTSGNEYTIVSYTSATVVTVTPDAKDDEGDDFEVAATGILRLPDDFAALLGKLHFDAGTGHTFGLDLVPLSMVEEERAGSSSAGQPRLGAIVPATYVAATGQRFDLHVWPTPGADYVLRGRYLRRIDAIPADTAYLPGGEEHAETIRASCLAAAEHEMDDSAGIHTELFVAQLAASILADQRAHAPDTLGIDEGGGRQRFLQRVDRTTYAGVQYE